jgi:hypothetical protein
VGRQRHRSLAVVSGQLRACDSGFRQQFGRVNNTRSGQGRDRRTTRSGAVRGTCARANKSLASATKPPPVLHGSSTAPTEDAPLEPCYDAFQPRFGVKAWCAARFLAAHLLGSSCDRPTLHRPAHGEIVMRSELASSRNPPRPSNRPCPAQSERRSAKLLREEAFTSGS